LLPGATLTSLISHISTHHEVKASHSVFQTTHNTESVRFVFLLVCVFSILFALDLIFNGHSHSCDYWSHLICFLHFIKIEPCTHFCSGRRRWKPNW